jgi:inorganic triphosphatase YgiF
LILFSPVGASAIALPAKTSNPAVAPNPTLPATPKAGPAVEKTETVLPKALEDARLAYEKAVQKTNTVIDGLSAQLASPSPDKNTIEDQQDALENVADKLDDLAEKVGKFGKNLTNSTSEALQKNLQALQQGLDNSVETINLLADDTERAKKGASPFLKTRIDQGIGAVKQNLQESDRALEDLISTVKAQLQKAA